MKRTALLCLILFCSAIAFGQSNDNCPPNAYGATCKNSQIISVSGNSVKIFNSIGATSGKSFEEFVNGSASAMSIVIVGYKTGGTHDTLDTNTGTSSTIRDKVNFSGTTLVGRLYDYFVVTATWTTAGTVSVTINTTLSTAVN